MIAGAAIELPPRRGQESTKFSSGEVLIVGGSRGMTGAVCMAALAATRAGAGYATVAAPAELEPILEAKLTEVMTIGLDGVGRRPRRRGRAPQVLERADAIGMRGPRARGWGAPSTRRAWRASWLRRIDAPLLIDADGLNALGTDLAAARRPIRSPPS